MTLSLFDDEFKFDVDQCLDIVNYGMSQGVSGFIYTREVVNLFREHEDEIEETLMDYIHDTMGKDVSYLAFYATQGNWFAESIDELIVRLVWSYVEIKCADYLQQSELVEVQ